MFNVYEPNFQLQFIFENLLSCFQVYIRKLLSTVAKNTDQIQFLCFYIVSLNLENVYFNDYI